MSKRAFWSLLTLCILTFIAVRPATAQVTTADAVGHVSDPKGLTVPQAKVTVTNKDTGAVRETTTSDVGDFAVTLLPPGNYKITVEKQGFATAVFDNVELIVGEARTFDVALKINTSSQTVLVTEEAPLVQTTSSVIQGNLAPLEIKELPVVDRNFAGLMSMIPGVRPAGNFDPTKTRSGNVTVNGSDGRAVDYNVDGGDNKDNVIGGLVQNFTMEGIQEFNVETDRYTAESGRAVGAVVNVISKSGTNNLHGSLFGLFQNSGLNAKAFTVPAGQGNPLFHRYQYGGSVGGKVIRDKLFFFGAFEQKREPGALNIDQNALTQLTALHNNSSTSNLASPVTQVPFPYRDDLVTVKLDHKISGKQSMYYRYGRERWTNPNDQLGNPIVTDLSQENSETNQFHSLVIGHSYVFSSSKVNSFSVHFQDFANDILAAPGRTFTLPTSNGGTATNPEICFPVNPGCGGGAPEAEVGQNVNVPQETLIRKYQFRDDFSWIMGRHNMKLGANYIYLAKLGGFFFFGAEGYQVTFWDYPATILSNAATYPQGFATGGAVEELAFSGGSGSTAQPPAHELGLYYQDDFKVSPRLTLNLGMRWDANPNFLTPQLTGNPSSTNRAIAILRQLIAAAPAQPEAQDGLTRARQIAGNDSLLGRKTASWKEFQPRIGFAWRPTGTDKFVVRGGYGIARDQIFQNLTLFSIQQEQPTLYQTFLDEFASFKGSTCPSGLPADDLCNFHFGVDPLPSPSSPPTNLASGATGRIIDPRLDDPWSQQSSIGFQWQFTNDYAFSADYYHVLGTHEPRVLQENPKLASLCNSAFPGSNPADPRCVAGTSTRLLDAAFLDSGIGIGRIGELRLYGTNNRSLYDGINFQVKKRFSRKFLFQVSDVVSWSRTWGGLATSAYFGSSRNITPERQFLPGEFGPTLYDERNRFSASGVFNLPYGFELAPLLQASTARPYTAFAEMDLDGDGRRSLDRACVGSTPTSPILTLGCQELPVNSFRGKPFVQLDLRTAKVFNITERMNFRLIWEMYNLFNRDNSCNNVDTSIQDQPGFGQAVGYCGGYAFGTFGPGFSGPYRSQFGFRFEF